MNMLLSLLLSLSFIFAQANGSCKVTYTLQGLSTISEGLSSNDCHFDEAAKEVEVNGSCILTTKSGFLVKVDGAYSPTAQLVCLHDGTPVIKHFDLIKIEN
ncbi:hypothetical protein MHBO_005140 [Bonamia ostreae]|uniref:Uncharacterized protein n=1 Tax=Bonamia ostreae TaxID=126728 RepID=A0ABV2AV60_9EUKA